MALLWLRLYFQTQMQTTETGSSEDKIYMDSTHGDDGEMRAAVGLGAGAVGRHGSDDGWETLLDLGRAANRVSLGTVGLGTDRDTLIAGSLGDDGETLAGIVLRCLTAMKMKPWAVVGNSRKGSQNSRSQDAAGNVAFLEGYLIGQPGSRNQPALELSGVQ